MGEEDVIGVFRRGALPLPRESIQYSPTKVHHLSEKAGLAHVFSAGSEVSPVLNSTYTANQKKTQATDHLFLCNDNIWVEHEGRSQLEFAQTYFDKIFSQFNLNDKGNASCPVICSMSEFSTEAGKQNFLRKLSGKKFVSVSIFDLEYDVSSQTNLIDFQIAPDLSLYDLTRQILSQSDAHLIVAFFSKKYDGTNLDQTRHHVDEFWAKEQRVNFIFPSSPYSLHSLFSFEFGTLSELLKNLTTDYEQCSDLIVNAQNEIAARYQEIENQPNKEDSAICSSSFIYFTRATIGHHASSNELVQTSDSATVRHFPALPGLHDLAVNNPNGFDKSACQVVEDIVTRLCHKSLNFLNELAHNENFEHREVLFAIALSIFDYLSEREHPLSRAQLTELYALYTDGHEPPFPDHLFRYMSRPPQRSRVALSKLFQAFHITTKWERDSPIYTIRTLDYIEMLRGGSPVSYRDLRNAFGNLVTAAKRINSNDEFQDCFGFEINTARACYPHGVLMLDKKFTKIMNKLVHRFHVVHNQELSHISLNGHFPRASLWVGSDETYFMPANAVNEGLMEFCDYFDSLRHPRPFGKCAGMIQLDHLQEPNWLARNWILKQLEGEEE